MGETSQLNTPPGTMMRLSQRESSEITSPARAALVRRGPLPRPSHPHAPAGPTDHTTRSNQ
eukprot:1635553-Prymnesium_polylepis.2